MRQNKGNYFSGGKNPKQSNPTFVTMKKIHSYEYNEYNTDLKCSQGAKNSDARSGIGASASIYKIYCSATQRPVYVYMYMCIYI